MILVVYDSTTGTIKAFFPGAESLKQDPPIAADEAWVKVDYPYEAFQDRYIDTDTVSPGSTIHTKVDQACPKCRRLVVTPDVMETLKNGVLGFEVLAKDAVGQTVNIADQFDLLVSLGDRELKSTAPTLESGAKQDSVSVPAETRKMEGNEVPESIVVVARPRAARYLGSFTTVRVKE